MKQEVTFKYLGPRFTEDGRMDIQIDIRCSKANQLILQLTYLLQHKKLFVSTKRNVIQSIFHSHLMRPESTMDT